MLGNFHAVFHIQHLIQLFQKGLILSSPFFFFLMEHGLFFFSAGNVDLFHAVLFFQDALGSIIQVDFLLVGGLELFPATLPMNSVRCIILLNTK